MTQRMAYDLIAPGGMKALGSVYGYIQNSGLPAELVELVYLRVSLINGCAYCIDLHTGALIDRGFWAQKLALVQAWREAGDLFSERERSALAWAEAVTKVVDTSVPNDAYDAAKAMFDDKELVDLTLAISLMNAFNRMAISFRKTPPSIAAV